MKILALNCGSSSVKYQVYEMPAETTIAEGQVERIGFADAILTHRAAGREPLTLVSEVRDHRRAIEVVIDVLLDAQHGVLRRKEEIAGVGHRVVHGGEAFACSTLISEAVIQAVRSFVRFAPLHNPHNLRGIEAAQALLPGVPQVAVFDTAFHRQMPRYAYIYALPYSLYAEWGIRRYGFHGTSHRYVSLEAARLLGRPLSELRLVTCHLGNGCSIAAVQYGVSVDTSMGFTPLEGLVMGTRSGDLDPALVPYIMQQMGLSDLQVDALLNTQSGLLGVSGLSSDMRDIEEAAAAGHERAQLALDIFCYRLKKYIGAYAAAMGGLDALVFTAGIGEKSAIVRAKSCAGLEFLGISLDPERNRTLPTGEISRPGAPVQVFIIPTDEELLIARDTYELVTGS
jgi:acetate kinase